MAKELPTILELKNKGSLIPSDVLRKLSMNPAEIIKFGTIDAQLKLRVLYAIDRIFNLVGELAKIPGTPQFLGEREKIILAIGLVMGEITLLKANNHFPRNEQTINALSEADDAIRRLKKEGVIPKKIIVGDTLKQEG